MKTLTFIILITSFFCFPLWAQKGITINSGAVLKIDGNVYLKISGDHNFINHSSSNQFGGTVIFSGTSEQMISGNETSEFLNLDINNNSGVVLGNNITIDNELILSSGILNINDFNLFMNENAVFSGSFSSNNFINTDGNGYLVKNVTGNGLYFFPIGDMTSGNDYSPVELDFISGSYTNGNISLQLKNTKHPNNTSVSNYINRYWTIQSSGITDFEVDMDLNYPVSDIIGSESEIFGGLWNGTSWFQLNPVSGQHITGIANRFGDITGAEESVFVNVNEFEAGKISVAYSQGNIFINNTGKTRYQLINIYSSLGQLIRSADPGAFNLTTIPFSPAKGLYVIELVSEKTKVHKKVLVN